MLYSSLFGKTNKTVPADADSVNARLLTQAGFIDQVMAGVYTYLPLGLRVLTNVAQIIREEMNVIGGQELLMPALHPRDPWQQTGRWDDPGKHVMFQFKGRGDKDVGLGWTHEEIITPLAKKFIHSYRDLPLAVYQIQDKFRNEPRAKSGLLRGREFLMKDLYSFHRDEADLDQFYAAAQGAYTKIFQRCGLDSLLTEASGGSFAKYSHEFQVLTENGEDTIFYCTKCRYAQNKEIAEIKEDGSCPKCGGTVRKGTAIEVGNIFRLKTKYTDAFDVTFADEEGALRKVLMGCYGIGLGRVMGAVVEVHHDSHGIRWPASLAPFLVHIVPLQGRTKAGEEAMRTADNLARTLRAAGIDALVDDRNLRPGEKFADADLIGCPIRLVLSDTTLAKRSVEWKERASTAPILVTIDQVEHRLRAAAASVSLSANPSVTESSRSVPTRNSRKIPMTTSA